MKTHYPSFFVARILTEYLLATSTRASRVSTAVTLTVMTIALSDLIFLLLSCRSALSPVIEKLQKN